MPLDCYHLELSLPRPCLTLGHSRTRLLPAATSQRLCRRLRRSRCTRFRVSRRPRRRVMTSLRTGLCRRRLLRRDRCSRLRPRLPCCRLRRSRSRFPRLHHTLLSLCSSGRLLVRSSSSLGIKFLLRQFEGRFGHCTIMRRQAGNQRCRLHRRHCRRFRRVRHIRIHNDLIVVAQIHRLQLLELLPPTLGMAHVDLVPPQIVRRPHMHQHIARRIVHPHLHVFQIREIHFTQILRIARTA